MSSLPTHLTEKQRKHAVLYMLFLIVFSWMSIKICLPALPHLSEVFATSSQNLKLSVSLFLACYAGTQTIWGIALQHYGRRFPILCCLVFGIVGSAVAMLSFNVETYIVGRCLEGIGYGCVSVALRAIMADCLDVKGFARTFSTASAICALVPALAPIFGGYLMYFFTWRAIFAFLLIASAIFWITGKIFLPNTQDPNEEKKPFFFYIQAYFSILKKQNFWGFSLSYAALQGSLLGYYAAMPFWYVSQFHMNERHYAFLALFTVATYVISLITARRLVKNIKVETLILFGLLVSGGVVILLVILAIMTTPTITLLVIVMSLYSIGAGFVVPSSNAGLIGHFKHIAAPASALASTNTFFSAAILSFIFSNLSVKSFWPLTIVLAIIILVTTIIYSCFSIRIKREML